MLFVKSKTFKTENTVNAVKTFAVGLCVFISACGSDNTQNVNAAQTNTLEAMQVQANSNEVDLDDNRLTAASTEVPIVSDLSASIVRAGLVSLQWGSADGDVYQSHTAGDAVSYYRVYRNGEFFIDTLSPFVEDPSPLTGQIEYVVESHKFVGAPEYAILKSNPVVLTIIAPSFANDAQRYSGIQLPLSEYVSALANFKTCNTSYDSTATSQLCTNNYGYAWQQFQDGRSGDLLHNTSSANAEFFVSVRNQEAELGIAPGVPVWRAKNLSSGETVEREFTLGSEFLIDGEGHVVNGAAIGDNGTVFISGTVYQSYLPRNRGIEVGVIPVTNAYYVAHVDIASGEIIQFKRFTLEQAPGVAATVNNGVLEMHKVGQLSTFDATTLTALSNTKVSGFPVFADDQFVYTRSYYPAAYYQFEKTVN